MGIKKITIKKFDITVLCVTILLILLSVFMGIKSFNFKEVYNNKLIFIYNTKKNIDYNVDIFPNSLFEESNLKSGEAYISNLVDDINVTIKYNYAATQIGDLEYTYKIETILNSEYLLTGDDNKESSVWSKTYTITEPVTKKIKASSFNINENVVFDYDYYNKLMKMYKKEVGLSTTSTALIKLTVDTKGLVNNKKFTSSEEVFLEIPLSQDAFKIYPHYEANKEYKISKYNSPKVKLNKGLLLLSSILFVISILLLVMIIRRIKNTNKTHYLITLNKILKEYGDVVIEVMTPADLNKSTTIEVKNFNEMIDLEERLRIPINFCETKKDKEGLFWLRYNDQYYKYVLKNKKD